MFRIGTAAVIPPQPPVPSDGYHSGYSSGNERPAVSAYSLASAADPAWHAAGQSHGGIVGHASSGSLGSGTNEPLGGGNGGGGGRVGGPPAAAAAAAAAATAAGGGAQSGYGYAGSGYASDRRAATAAAAAAAAYPTAYPVAPVPTPVLAPAPAYDYNVAAYGPMAGSMNAIGGMGAIGANPYAGPADPYAMGSDPSGAYAAAACAAYFANVPLHAAHAQIRAMGYADPAATMQYWQQCLDCYSRGYPAMPGYPSGGGGYAGVAAPSPAAPAAPSAPSAPSAPAAAPPPASDPAPRKASAATSVGKADGDGDAESAAPTAAAVVGDAEDGASATSDVAAPSSGSGSNEE